MYCETEAQLMTEKLEEVRKAVFTIAPVHFPAAGLIWRFGLPLSSPEVSCLYSFLTPVILLVCQILAPFAYSWKHHSNSYLPS